ncbi:MAG: cupin domain-containing protein [Symploca sp. SIO1B1]|nr:cupin domain-containing protein [Symploca sp. SIO1C2]NER96182.1 cupin domain-containing protein [Symploca sp. SIO1B1]
MTNAQYWIEKLQLDKLEEIGGYFRVHLKSEQTIYQTTLDKESQERRFWQMNYYLLQNSDVTILHRLKQDEMWHFYAGKALAIHLFPDNGNYQQIKLGSNSDAGEVFQAVAPHDTWFGSTMVEPNSFALAGTTLAPSWHPKDSRKPTPQELEKLRETYPQHQELINRLTRC